MLHRISTKLVVATMAATVLPFCAFAFTMNEVLAERLTRHVVQQALMGLVKDLAGQIDRFVHDRSDDIEQWANAPFMRQALVASEERRADAEPANGDTDGLHQREVRLAGRELDRCLRLKRVFDLILLVDRDGKLTAVNSLHPEGGELTAEFLSFLYAQDYADEPWFQHALRGQSFRENHHVSPFHVEECDTDPARRYQLGFGSPVTDPRDPTRVLGAVYALVNWKHVQDLVSSAVITDAFRGLVPEDEQPSPYSWIWDADADTILGHPLRELYYQSISRDVELPALTQAVRDSESGWGLYPEYHFQGKDKNAAFKRCAGEDGGGFGWVVGVGIDNDDIYATAEGLRSVLLGGAGAVLLVAVVLIFLIARRTTGPILELQRMTRRVAEGDLDARIEIRTRDELGALAEDFNRMTRELKEQRERIVKAEKDAAWREMARQIAHDIKNPLTPMTLSLDLLEKARRESAEGSDEILERTMRLVRRQVENLRKIAGDFYEFTGGRKPDPEHIDLHALVQEVLHLHDAWAVEQGVTVHVDGARPFVEADRGKLSRVFTNLASNALQAMPEGGDLYVEIGSEPAAGEARVTLRDTGVGLSDEIKEHLFEPYFTTKSEGTGLGLAISKRVLEEMDGRIALEASSDGRGTVATVWLPMAAEGAGPA